MAATRTYVTRADRKFVGQSATDGELYWFVDASGKVISPTYVNRAQVTMFARRTFGPLINWDPIMYGC